MRRLSLFLGVVAIFLFTGQGCISLGGNDSPNSGPAGVFVSTDRGENWRELSTLIQTEGTKSISSVSVYRIVPDPKDTRAMYLATRSHGLFFTYDEGRTWQQPAGPVSTGFIYSAAIHPTSNCVIYATNGVQVYKTTDCSRNWTEVYREQRSNVQIVSLAFDQLTPQRVLMAENNGDLLQTLDEGASWSVLTRLKTQIAEIVSDELQPNVLYLATRSDGLYRSDDGGQTWVERKQELATFSGALEYRRLVLHPSIPNLLYWVSTYGILVSDNGGASWKAFELITPPGSVSIYGFAVHPTDTDILYYTSTLKDGSRPTFYRSDDGGASWTTKRLPSAQIPSILRVHPDKPDWIYVGFSLPLTK